MAASISVMWMPAIRDAFVAVSGGVRYGDWIMEQIRKQATSNIKTTTLDNKRATDHGQAEEEKIFMIIPDKNQTPAGTKHRDFGVIRQAKIGGRKSGPQVAKECSVASVLGSKAEIKTFGEIVSCIENNTPLVPMHRAMH